MLEELAKRKLRMPKGLKAFIRNETDYKVDPGYRRSRYVKTLELYKGKLLERTFAYKQSRSTGELMVNEVHRRLQGYRKALEKDIYCGISGKQITFNERFKDKKFYIIDTPYYFYADEMYDRKKVIEELDIPYCQYFSPKNLSGLDFFEYISRYLEEPKIELLVKAGLSQYVRCYKKLNLKEKSLDKIFRVEPYWVEHLKELEYSDLIVIKNHYHKIKTMDDLRNYWKAKSRVATDCRKVNRYLQPRNFKFVQEMDYGLMNIYDDYLNFCEQLKYDLNDKSVLCPKDLKKEHDKLMELIKVKKDEQTKEKFFQAYQNLLPYVYSQENYVIVPCENIEELEKESEALHHCVKTYAETYADRKTNIMFIRDIHNVTEPLVTLEFKNKKVIQARADHNAKPCESVIDFISEWAKEYKLAYEA